MTTSQKKLLLDKTVYISTGLVISLCMGLWFAASQWTKVQAQVDQNTKDITGIQQELHDLNGNLTETNKNLVETNTNVTELKTLLKQQ